MLQLNTLLNQVEEMTRSDSIFIREVSSRLMTAAIVLPLELTIILQNLIKLACETGETLVQVPTKAVAYFIDSVTLQEFNASLTTTEWLSTAWKVIKYVMGSIFTIIPGIIAPSLNFRLHIAMGLAMDMRQASVCHEIEEKGRKEKKIKDEVLQHHYKDMLHSLQSDVVKRPQLPYND